MSALYLTQTQIKQLNDIYMGIVRKYTNYSTESIALSGVLPLTQSDCTAMAEDQTAGKRTKVLNDYADRVMQINTNAAKRGLSQSSVVIALLDKALTQKNDALAQLDAAVDKLAAKILSDNQKLICSIEREKSTGKSRSLRDYIAMSRLNITASVPTAQSLIDEDLYNAYLEWLLQFTPADALSYLQNNAVFYQNCSTANYQKLLTEITRRAA